MANYTTEPTRRTALAQLIADNRTYIALASPTAAQNTAQIKALTRQVNRLLSNYFIALPDEP